MTLGLKCTRIGTTHAAAFGAAANDAGGNRRLTFALRHIVFIREEVRSTHNTCRVTGVNAETNGVRFDVRHGTVANGCWFTDRQTGCHQQELSSWIPSHCCNTI